MTWVTFGPFIGIDPSYPEFLVRNQAGLVYAITDTTFTTPLSIRSLAGATLTEIRSDARGVVDEFEADVPGSVYEANWKSGVYVVRMRSFKSVQDAAVAATTAANQAVRNMGGAGRIWGRLASEGMPTAGQGAADGDWCFVDAN